MHIYICISKKQSRPGTEWIPLGRNGFAITGGGGQGIWGRFRDFRRDFGMRWGGRGEEPWVTFKFPSRLETVRGSPVSRKPPASPQAGAGAPGRRPSAVAPSPEVRKRLSPPVSGGPHEWSRRSLGAASDSSGPAHARRPVSEPARPPGIPGSRVRAERLTRRTLTAPSAPAPAGTERPPLRSS